MNSTLLYLKNLIQIMLNPVHGWEDLKAESPDNDRMFRCGFVPMICVVAITVWTNVLYAASWSVVDNIIMTLGTLAAYFAGYYVAVNVLSMCLPGIVADELYDDRSIMLYCMSCLGLLSLINILSNCIPFDMALLTFLPAYVLVVMWQGRNYLGVKAGSYTRFFLLAVVSVMLPVLAVKLLFDALVV